MFYSYELIPGFFPPGTLHLLYTNQKNKEINLSNQLCDIASTLFFLKKK